MIQKILGIAAVCGLAISLPGMSPKPTQAAPQAGRVLSAMEMQKTTGAGQTCTKVVCNGTDVCADSDDLQSSTSYHYTARSQCEEAGWMYPVTCSNFGSGTCTKKTFYDAAECLGNVTGTSDPFINFCGATA